MLNFYHRTLGSTYFHKIIVGMPSPRVIFLWGFKMSTAILIDGGFFIKRYRSSYPNENDPRRIAKSLYDMCLKHISQKDREINRELYRIFYYDCSPLLKKICNPISNATIDMSKTKESIFRQAFHAELKKLRKVALRFGHLADHNCWQIVPDKLKKLLSGGIQINDLKENDVIYVVRQKGVDMKIGLDIASLAYKRLVNQIILVAGDSDFVPAAKLARREGIDFILDPMWNPIRPDLHEHIDGLQSTITRPKRIKK